MLTMFFNVFSYDRRSISIVLQPSPLILRTRSQLKNLSKDKLINELFSFGNLKNDINAKFSELNDGFNDFQAKYQMVKSSL